MPKRKNEPTSTVLPKLLRIGEVSRLLGVGRWMLYQQVQQGNLRCARLGRAIRLSEVEVLRWLESQHTANGKQSD